MAAQEREVDAARLAGWVVRAVLDPRGYNEEAAALTQIPDDRTAATILDSVRDAASRGWS